MRRESETRPLATARASGAKQRAAAGTRLLNSQKSSVTIFAENGAKIIRISGRLLWALKKLMAAGTTGLTPVDMPAPRWSAYVHLLRELGVEIETIRERHEGEFPGNHGRYVLRSSVRIDGGGGV